MARRNITLHGLGLLVVLGVSLVGAGLAAAADRSILHGLSSISAIASTVPGIGDVNPYGVFQVPTTTGNLEAGDILVSNFNNSANLQGTGTTIMQVAPDGSVSVFAQIDATKLPGSCPGGVGLTTALVVLQSGWVIVGSLPTTDGMPDTIGAGCLIVLNSSGSPVETFSGNMINGPWDMTVNDSGQTADLFVTNVLNGTVAAGGNVVNEGTVLRIHLTVSQNTMPQVQSTTVVGSGFPEHTDPAALVIGPTGVGLSPACPDGGSNCASPVPADARVLYVADSADSRIAVIPHALTRTTTGNIGTTLAQGGGLNDPLGLTVAPNGNVLTVNGNNGFITEFTPEGRRIAIRLLNNTGAPPPGNGTLFGLIFDRDLGVVFVDDGSNTLNLLH
ncbi:MAG TPA: hypothetical protein VGW37_09900 [Terriglobia bacterium]|nr:hypothetical protein [Terriglobia bacterium]